MQSPPGKNDSCCHRRRGWLLDTRCPLSSLLPRRYFLVQSHNMRPKKTFLLAILCLHLSLPTENAGPRKLGLLNDAAAAMQICCEIRRVRTFACRASPFCLPPLDYVLSSPGGAAIKNYGPLAIFCPCKTAGREREGVINLQNIKNESDFVIPDSFGA